MKKSKKVLLITFIVVLLLFIAGKIVMGWGVQQAVENAIEN